MSKPEVKPEVAPVIAAADMSIADLEKMIAARKGVVAVDSFSEAKEAAEKAGFTATIAPAHNGGSPALRVDY